MPQGMSAGQWARIEALFPQLEALPPAQRDALLDRECGDDPLLRAELVAMLAADAKGGFSGLPVAVSAAPRSGHESLAEGTQIGSWQIEALIGRGGMGEVYRARRADGAFGMTVALKLLKRGLDTASIVERFLRERRILAQLSHPNIARLLDAGSAPDGRPYFVLEHVHGVPITTHCHAQALDARHIAGLLCVAAEAVAAAHRAHIVHRDLKPSNVLVTAEGQIKLLDFGIAKLLDEQDHDETRLSGALPMTPSYAAPEQILGEPVTPATDVYALGTLLYLLLTGRLPHAREGLPGAALALGLRDERALPPSSVVARVEGLMAAAERRRRVSELAGDLDCIVLKALQGEPRRRYASAADLAADLRRYLEHWPVLARPDSTAYRLWRFARRYRVAVAAGSAVGIALSVGAGVALWQAQLARQHAARATAQSQRAEQVKNFVLSVFREQDATRRTSVEPRSPQQLVAKGLARLDEELAGDPELRAELQAELAEIHVGLGGVKDGRRLLEQALREQARLHGEESLAYASTLQKLSRAVQADGHLDEAVAISRRALGILMRVGAGDTLAAARTRQQLAHLLAFGRASTPEAVALLAEAAKGFEVQLGADHPETVMALHDQASMLEQSRKDDEAERLAREVIARLERSVGHEAAALRQPLVTLAILQKRGGRHDEATATYARAAAVTRRHLGTPSRDLARVLTSWADLLQTTGDLRAAEQRFGEAQAALPPDAVNEKASLLHDWGQLRLDAGDPARAEQLLAESVKLRHAVAGEDNGFAWFTSSERGRALAQLGRLDEALVTQREALARLGKIMGEQAYQNSLILDALADTLLLQKEFAEAAALRRRALQLTLAAYAPSHRLAAIRQFRLARELAAAGTPGAESGALLEQSIATFRATADDEPALALALLERGRQRLAAGARAAARADLAEAVLRLEKSQGADRGPLEQARALLAHADR